MNEYRPGGFQILPPAIKNLIIVNVLVFAATYVLQKARIVDLDYYLGLFQWNSPLFKPWQLITHMFMHGGLGHLAFNMLALWMFGNVIENILGTKRFLIFYFVCGIGAALCHSLVFSWEHQEAITWFHQFSAADKESMVNTALLKNQGDTRIVPMLIPMVGASGAIFGLLFAFGYLFPNTLVYVYLLFPIKAKYFVAIYALTELFYGFSNSSTDHVAHFAHLGGMLFAWLLLRAWKVRGNRNYY
ncbi:MAG: rhomboid family intramembrane serine protease [Edaphocola sp.]